MNLHQIGKLVRERRDTLGLSQDRLAKMAGLSRATINQLGNGALVDLGVIKLACLLELVGLTFEARARATPHRGPLMASRLASVGYKTQIDAGQLAKALATGEVPPDLLTHVATFLDEAPLPLVVSAVEKAAKRGRVPPKRIWQHVVRWASEVNSPPRAWA